MLAKDKFLNGSRLIVEETPALMHCPKCGTTADLEGGDEVVITKLRIQTSPKK